MKRTIDTLTGKPFRWNTTTFYQGHFVPARVTGNAFVFLHPDRVPTALLDRLNTPTEEKTNAK